MATKCAIGLDVVSHEVNNQWCYECCNNIIIRKWSQLTASEMKVIDQGCGPSFLDLMQTKNFIEQEMSKQVLIIKHEFSSHLMELINKLGEIQTEEKFFHKFDKTVDEAKPSHSGISSESTNVISSPHSTRVNANAEAERRNGYRTLAERSPNSLLFADFNPIHGGTTISQ
ncbi:hypothetical protein JTB14_034573 [Gonioctena quinquepunctata]|nr:hypothetical protein JTB14_034573 [Gonioctena quinquepunctata]